MVSIEFERGLVYVVSVTCLTVFPACGMTDDPETEPPSEAPPASAPYASTDGDLDRQIRRMMRSHGVEEPEQKGPYDPAVVELGRNLFFDKALSATKDVACATCHHTTYGASTSDGLALPVGVGGRGEIPNRRIGNGRRFEPRNSIELFNLGLEGIETMFWDGRLQRTPSGEMVMPREDAMPRGLDDIVTAQPMLPVLSRVEMRGHPDASNPVSKAPDHRPRQTWSALLDRLLGYAGYRRLFREAYPNKSLEDLGFRDAARAIGRFEQSEFTYLDSPFDRYLRGDDEALTRRQKRGAQIFYGKGRCADCHSGALTTDQEFHNLATPQIGPGKGSMRPLDPGRYLVTGRPSQMYAFRTPPLRNVELTHPYMHSGAYATLEDAIEHHLDAPTALSTYDGEHLPPSLRAQVHVGEEVRERLVERLDDQIEERAAIQRQPGHRLRVTEADVDRLVAFLEAMTSPTAIHRLDREMPASVPSGRLEDGVNLDRETLISALPTDPLLSAIVPSIDPPGDDRRTHSQLP